MPKISHQPTITHELAKKPNITHELTQAQKPTHTYELAKKPIHEDEKIALVLFLQVVLQYGIFFDETCHYNLRNGISQNRIRLPMFDELVITILEMTPDVVYISINLSLQF